MTTIAYRDGVMAADSRASYGDTIVPGDTVKLFRFKDGSVAGVTGSEALWRRLLSWIEGGREGPQPAPSGDKSGSVILMTSSAVEVFEDGYSYIEPCSFMAYGSGQASALGALYAGASAAEAVRIATLCDKHSGGPVMTMTTG